jgi:aspartate-semialdehyde dehydrogenase
MQPSLAIIGSSGLVGAELYTILKETSYPLSKVSLFSKSQKEVSANDFSLIDIAFFCAGSNVSKEFVPTALKAGSFVIDSSSAFRTDPKVPLVIPEINGHLLKEKPPIIASPNCVASLMLMALYPLHQTFGIARVIASSYQAASGAGKKGLEALASKAQIAPFPSPLKDNLFIHESPQDEDGFCEEEKKIVFEIGKILETNFPIQIRCIRVPIERAHSISLHITLKKQASREALNRALELMPGLQITPSPNPLLANHKNTVWTTPARIDPSDPKALSLFVVGDQLRKGAALNAWQIALKLTTINGKN